LAAVITKKSTYSMGGIVSHDRQLDRPHAYVRYDSSCSIHETLQTSSKSTKSGKTSHSGRNSPVKLAAVKSSALCDYPLLSFEEVQNAIPLCKKSWQQLEVTSVTNGIMLKDAFEFHVADNLGNAENEAGSAIVRLLRTERGGQKALSISKLVDRIVRFVTKKRLYEESAFKKKLMKLGREHARIGISHEMIGLFCEIFINSLSTIIRSFGDANDIIHSWKVNLRYVLTHMTAVRFSFLRAKSGKIVCSACEGRGSRSTGLCVECSAIYAMINSPSFLECDTPSLSLMGSDASGDGRRGRCYSIPENVDGEGMSSLIARPDAEVIDGCC
jgi:hypothetical protein